MREHRSEADVACENAKELTNAEGEYAGRQMTDSERWANMK
jgi:hypothetical protein